MSANDSLSDTQEKMQEYVENKVRLGWLINRMSQTVEIYRLEQAVEVVSIPCTLSGEDMLPEFELKI